MGLQRLAKIAFEKRAALAEAAATAAVASGDGVEGTVEVAMVVVAAVEVAMAMVEAEVALAMAEAVVSWRKTADVPPRRPHILDPARAPSSGLAVAVVAVIRAL